MVLVFNIFFKINLNSRGRPVCPVCNYDLRTGRAEETSLTSEAQSVSLNPDDEQQHSSGIISFIYILMHRGNCIINERRYL